MTPKQNRLGHGSVEGEVYFQEGSVTRKLSNNTDGSFVLATEMDCEQVIRENRALREQPKKRNETFRLAARVPMPIAEMAMKEGWFHDDKKWEQWLNDPQNKDFRVYEGRV